jgi:gluconokinase
MSGAPPRVVLCGVAGAGKTTIGRRLAPRVAVPFVDADDFHPPENRARMARGEPLDEAHRRGWLQAVHAELRARVAAGQGFVLACSALRAAHRATLAAGVPGLTFVHLRVDAATLRARLAARTGHFFPAALLDSQLQTWEDLRDGAVVDADAAPDAIVEAVLAALRA